MEMEKEILAYVDQKGRVIETGGQGREWENVQAFRQENEGKKYSLVETESSGKER